MTEIKILEKKEKIRELLYEVYEPEMQFFDIDSDKMLDEKLEVLEALKAGKTISEIPNFYKVLELMPTEDMWDL